MVLDSTRHSTLTDRVRESSSLRRSHALRWISTAMALSACLAGCELTTPVTPYKPNNLVFELPMYKERAPSVVGVLPVTGGAVPKPESAEKLRERLYYLLMDKRYSALACDFVDSQLRHAGIAPLEDPQTFREVLPCDAVIHAELKSLDLQTYRESERAVVQGEITLTEVRSGAVLWRANYEHIVKPSSRQGTLRPGQDFDEACLEQFMQKCLALLPDRPDPIEPESR